jgi:hypothetical protein
VELCAEHEGVIFDLSDLNQPVVGRNAGAYHPVRFESGAKVIVKLKAMTMAFFHHICLICRMGFRPLD